MAKYRQIKDQFWSDPYVRGLSTDQKLVFLYLLTNPQTRLCGMYEISIDYISFETGIHVQMIEEILQKFCMDGKIARAGSWINVVNFQKHQSQKNPSVQEGIKREILEIPENIRLKLQAPPTLYTPSPHPVPNMSHSTYTYTHTLPIPNPTLRKAAGVGKKSFKKPSVEEINAYCQERQNNINPNTFYDFYESKGWIVGKQPMKDWKACVRTWEGNGYGKAGSSSEPTIYQVNGKEVSKDEFLRAKKERGLI